jgi:hypothetical protein
LQPLKDLGVFIKKVYLIYIGVAIVIIAGVVAYIFLSANSGSPLIGAQVSGSQISALQRIANNNTLASQVGTGIVLSGSGSNIPKKIIGPVYATNGKPEVLYVGGDFCPYCAVTRWGLILALMRFGNFTGLTYMESSPTDVYADTATFSFRNSSYKSALVHFDGIETADRNGNNITNANFTPTERFTVARYNPNGGIPFVDFANSSIQDGAAVSPELLHGYGWQEIIGNLSNQDSPIAQGIIGSANIFTAYICMSNATLNSMAPACRENYTQSIVAQQS